jgi:hypothetical protein
VLLNLEELARRRNCYEVELWCSRHRKTVADILDEIEKLERMSRTSLDDILFKYQELANMTTQANVNLTKLRNALGLADRHAEKVYAKLTVELIYPISLIDWDHLFDQADKIKETIGITRSLGYAHVFQEWNVRTESLNMWRNKSKLLENALMKQAGLSFYNIIIRFLADLL